MPRFYSIFFTVSVILMVASIAALFAYGLKLGVDFTGGSVLEVTFDHQRPTADALKAALPETAKDATVNLTGSQGAVIRLGTLTEAEHQALLKSLDASFKDAGLHEARFDSVGPVVGNELKSKSISAIIYTLLAITVYLGFVFRKLSRTFSLWTMSVGTLVALAQDILLPLGLFAWLGHAYDVEISAVFVAALLTILGYAISDRVIILDRVRENLLRGGIKGETFGQLVHRSVIQTMGRSINTAMTVLLALVAIFLFGGESIRYFALALIVGIVSGAYSSIFVASPILVWVGGRRMR